jgi:nucleoside-diphosphate-sugar epimerase
MDKECWKNSEVLITGGLGFIGSNLAHGLVNLGAKVTVLDNLLKIGGGNLNNIRGIRSKIRIIKEDVRNWEVIKQAVRKKEFIFHLAAQVDRKTALENPAFDLEINCNGTLNILEACRLYNKEAKIIYTSSRAVIGEPKYLPVDEEHPTDPKDVYGINKLAAEKYCVLYHGLYNLRTAVLRLNNVYGPRAQLRYPHYGVLNLFIGYALTDRKIPIYGDGNQTRDYVFVDDVVKALILAAENEKSVGEIFFVGSNKETKLIDVVKMIIDVLGKGSYTFVPFPPLLERADIRRFVASYNKIEKSLGWRPGTTLSNGIAKTIEFYRKNLKYYLP